MVSFFVCLGFILLLKPLAFKIGLVDYPSGRRTHIKPAALIGGLSLVLSAGVSSYFLNQIAFILSAHLLLPLFLILILGVVDDFKELRPKIVFLFQIVAAYLAIYLGGGVSHIGNLFGQGVIHTSYLCIPFSIIAIIGVINAANMADGLDGLLGSLALIALMWFAIIALEVGRFDIVNLSSIIIGALLAFLSINLRTRSDSNATIFLGNAGSMTLGFILAWIPIQLSGPMESNVTPITCVWVIGLLLMDMARVMLRRFALGNSMFAADRIHLHHLLEDIGCSRRFTLALMITFSVMLGGFGVYGWMLKLPEWIMFVSFMALLVIYIVYLGPWLERRADSNRLIELPNTH